MTLMARSAKSYRLIEELENTCLWLQASGAQEALFLLDF